ncbi:MAG: TolC family protein [Bacteriovoracaceae bacterium]|nr:TolC family protein [Bacteroidota bacterium]
MKNIVTIVSVLYIIVMQSMTAQNTDTTRLPLTIDAAVRLAVQHNAELQSARLEVKRSDARVMEAWGYTMPSVDLSGTFNHIIEKPKSYFPDAIYYPLVKLMDSSARVPRPTGQLIELPFSMTPTNSANAALNVRQILFNGSVFIGVGAASIYSELSRDVFLQKKVETVAKVRKAYYGALLAREALLMMRSNLINAEENLKNVQLMRTQGIVSEYDELRATVGVDNLRPVVLQSETNYNLAVDNLRNTIGIGDSVNIIPSEGLVLQEVDEGIVQSADQAVLESNPNLNIVKHQIELNSASVNAERANYLPTIVAFGSYSYTAIKDNYRISTNDFYKTAQVGLNFSLNLFQGLQTNSRIEQAQLERQKTEEQKGSLERNLQMGIRSLIGNLRQARKRIDAQQKTVETAERGYKIVTTRFLSNAATQLEVNDAQLALSQAKVNRMQSIYDYLVAASELDSMLGRLPENANEMD